MACFFLHLKLFLTQIVRKFKRLFSLLNGNEVCEDKKTKLPTFYSLPIFGHLHLFLFGKYSFERLTEAVFTMSNKLGNRFMLNLAGEKMFITLEPEDAQTLFKNEGILPKRPSFEALIHYRNKEYGSIGCVPGNGDVWKYYRQGMQHLLKLPVYKSYKVKQQEIAIDFIDYIEEIKGNKKNKINNVLEHIMLYTIEAIAAVCPGVNFGCINAHFPPEEAQRIIKASCDFMDGLYETMKGPPLWKYYQTSGYLKLKSSHEAIFQIMNKHMLLKKQEFEENPELFKENHAFMYELFNMDSSYNYSWEDKIVLAIEVFLGGIDASATVISFALYYLAKNPQCQVKAREDERFLINCVHETMRLSPTSGAIGRYLPKDVEFSGYLIPKGTLVLPFTSVMSLIKIDGEGNEFNPDRKINNFVSMPFGYGPRMCPGRKLAIQEIVVVLQEILKNYEISTESENVGMMFRMNRIPDKDISISFKKL